MPTNAQTVKSYLDFALLQLGAESYLHGLEIVPANQLQDATVDRWKYGFNDLTHPFIDPLKGGRAASDPNDPTAPSGADKATLPGNNRMVTTQANNLFSEYEIIDHHANDATGFTATLFKNRASGEYTLSFRSTEARPWEVAGDAERDHDGANKVGIYENGFAFAQLASMEDYWTHISAGERWDKDANQGKGTWVPGVAGEKLATFRDDLNSGKALYTTGYSLAGHLASVFTLMHEDKVTRTYTFNGAGHGILTKRDATQSELAVGTTGAAVSQMLAAYARALKNPGLVTDAELESSILIGEANPAQALQQLIALRNAAVSAANAANARDPFATENGLINSAGTPRANIYKDPRYEFAARYVAGVQPTKTLAQGALRAVFGVLPNLVQGLFGDLNAQNFQAFGEGIQNGSGSDPKSGAGYNKIVSISGQATHDDFQGVADSQRHTANTLGVFIEDQPDVYGSGGLLLTGDGLPYSLLGRTTSEVVGKIKANKDGGPGDYATSHALILLIDSLSLAKAIQELAPQGASGVPTSLETIEALMAAISNQRGESNYNSNGTAKSNPGVSEGDSLENLLDALRRIVLPAATVQGKFATDSFFTPFDRKNDGFGNFKNRTDFFSNLADLKARGASPGFTLESLIVSGDGNPDAIAKAATPKSATDIATVAKDPDGAARALAHRYALSQLNPFVLVGTGLYADYNTNGALEVYDPATGRTAGALTLGWIDDRTEMLRRKTILGLHNLNNDLSVSSVLEKSDSNINSKSNTSPNANPLTTTVAEAQAAVSPFKNETVVYDDRTSGYRIDFRNAGENQRIVFGGESTDVAQGAALTDRIYGGGGTDFLAGGKGSDRLEGGRGMDLYHYSAAKGADPSADTNDGTDTILDTDGKGVLRYSVTDGGTVTSAVIGGAAIKQSATQWKSLDGKFTYDKDGVDLKVTIAGVADGSVTIKDFDFAKAASAGYLGIRLVDALPALPETPDGMVGDKAPVDASTAAGIQYQYDTWGNYAQQATDEVVADVLYGRDNRAERIQGFAGNDLIFGDVPQLLRFT